MTHPDHAALIEQLDGFSKHTRDEYLHELTGRSRDALTALLAERDRMRGALADAKASLSVAIYGLPAMLEANALSDEEGMVGQLEAAMTRMEAALKGDAA